MGSRSAVSFLHAWLTKLIINWVTSALRKKVAIHKTQILASDKRVRSDLRVQLGDLSRYVGGEGEFLGTDFACGAPLRLRPVSRKRLKKACSRKRRLKWWRSLGGAAHEVARGGLVASAAHGAPAHGIPCSHLRDLRRIQAASVPIKAAGASATAKLAVGGNHHGESDPAVLLANPPLRMLADVLWDAPRARGDHVSVWKMVKRELAGVPLTRAWRMVRGPVGAAWLHLERIDAIWKKPFVITLLDVDVDLLEVPPRMVARILREHARRHYDRVLLASLATDHGWELPRVMHTYAKGIDWPLVRDVLNGKRGNLTTLERKALMVLVTGAAWPEERRWRIGGMLPTGSCMACCMGIGSTWHKNNECGAAEQELTWMRLGGRIVRRPRDAAEVDLAPLATLGLPPLLRDGRPVELSLREGAIPRDTQGIIFGDASGVGLPRQSPEVVTWAVITLNAAGDAPAYTLAGSCGGWYPSVARGELQALVESLQIACIPASYAGDCQYVVDGLCAGIPRSLASSSSIHADLWRRARWLLRDHGEGIDGIKVKAHRSRARAETEVDGGGIELWQGNRCADLAAKSLALRLWEDLKTRAEELAARRGDFVASMARNAICSRLAQVALDSLKMPRVTMRRYKKRGAMGPCGEHDMIPRELGGGRWCAKCKLIARTPTSLKTLASRPCRGEVLLGVHQSHHLRWSAGVTWCERCGFYMSRLPRALRLPCTGAPRSAAASNVLRRLRSGLPPTTAVYLQKGAANESWTVGVEALWATGGDTHGDVRAIGEPDPSTSDPRAPSTSVPEASAPRERHGAPDPAAPRAGDWRRQRASVGVGGAAAPGKAIFHRDEVPPSLSRRGPRQSVSLPPRVLGDLHAVLPRPGEPPGRALGQGSHRLQECRRADGPPARDAPRPADAPSRDSPIHDGVAAIDTERIRGRVSGVVVDQRALLQVAPPKADVPSPLNLFCRPPAGAPWTRRLVPIAAFTRRECGVCHDATASRCRGCHGPLCIGCAKDRRSCGDSGTPRHFSAGDDGYVRDHHRPSRHGEDVANSRPQDSPRSAASASVGDHRMEDALRSDPLQRDTTRIDGDPSHSRHGQVSVSASVPHAARTHEALKAGDMSVPSAVSCRLLPSSVPCSALPAVASEDVGHLSHMSAP